MRRKVEECRRFARRTKSGGGCYRRGTGGGLRVDGEVCRYSHLAKLKGKKAGLGIQPHSATAANQVPLPQLAASGSRESHNGNLLTINKSQPYLPSYSPP